MGRIRHCLTWCLFLLLAGCGGGGGGGVDNNTDVERVGASVVSTPTLTQSHDETATFEFQYSDADDAQLTLSLEYSLDNGNNWVTVPELASLSLDSGAEPRTGQLPRGGRRRNNAVRFFRGTRDRANKPVPLRN